MRVHLELLSLPKQSKQSANHQLTSCFTPSSVVMSTSSSILVLVFGFRFRSSTGARSMFVVETSFAGVAVSRIPGFHEERNDPLFAF